MVLASLLLLFLLRIQTNSLKQQASQLFEQVLTKLFAKHRLNCSFVRKQYCSSGHCKEDVVWCSFGQMDDDVNEHKPVLFRSGVDEKE
jgi:hypothetical protein